MSKKAVVRIISFAICVSLVGFGFFFKEREKTKKYEIIAENEYYSGISSLSSSLSDITTTLNKVVYIKSGGDLSELSAKLYAQGEVAKDALAKLSGNQNNDTVNKFLSQVGNYAMWVSKSGAENDSIGTKERENLIKLYNTSKRISEAVDSTHISFENKNEFTQTLEEKVEKNKDNEDLATYLSDLEEDLSDYPTLIYDGPFSDHILTKEPLMVKNAPEKSKEYCRKRAENILGFGEGSLKYDGEEDGKIPCFRFSNNNVTVSMSRKGGYVVYMRKNRDVAENKITAKTAINLAKEFMKRLDVTNMTESYYYTDEGVCVINFAYKEGDTICYTDLVKVGVATDTGEIMLLETKGYLTNHTNRSFDSLKHSQKSAQRTLNDNLRVKSTGLALIPTDGGGEKRCFEFLCDTTLGQEVIVFVNPTTLETENILILQKSDAGTLTR